MTSSLKPDTTKYYWIVIRKQVSSDWGDDRPWAEPVYYVFESEQEAKEWMESKTKLQRNRHIVYYLPIKGRAP